MVIAIICRLLIVVQFFLSSPAAFGQESPASFGIPNNSPGAMWPRFQSTEALSPLVLYPNGSQFGLSNTSGGFGMTGSGSISAVGLERASLPFWVSREIDRSYFQQKRLLDAFARESQRSSLIFSAALSRNLAGEMRRASMSAGDYPGEILTPVGVPAVDSVLRDQAPDPESILRTRLP